MGPVAQGARFGNRCVFPQEGATLLSVTAIARVIGVISFQQEVVAAVMNIMAIATGHVACPQRMPGRLVGVRAGPLVAGKTHFLLFNRVKYRVTFTVNVVTGHTGNAGTFMRAAKPAEICVVLMTAETGTVLLGC